MTATLRSVIQGHLPSWGQALSMVETRVIHSEAEPGNPTGQIACLCLYLSRKLVPGDQALLTF
jgi:hypothetical protein